ncbi:MAG: hypothetical protein ACFNUE_07150, partial [Bacteroides sp.]
MSIAHTLCSAGGWGCNYGRGTFAKRRQSTFTGPPHPTVPLTSQSEQRSTPHSHILQNAGKGLPTPYLRRTCVVPSSY